MKKYLLIALSFYCIALFAQEPAYLHYRVQDGLPSSLVYCMLQDKKGFMWFGTNNGLVRFDGLRFKGYGIDEGLPDPEVLNIFEDSQERLWISCFQKKPCYLKNGKFFTAENDSLLNEVEFKSGEYKFYEDESYGICITGKGLNICFIKNRQVKCYEALQKHPITSTMNFASIDGKPIVYGVGSIFAFTDPMFPINIYSSKLSNSSILPFQYLSKNIFYLSIGNLLTTVKLGEQGVVDVNQIYDLPNLRNKINFIDNGNIWISYPHSLNGAFRVRLGNAYKINTPENFLKGKSVSNAFADNEKNIWFTTLNDGVFVMPEKVAVNYPKSNQPVFTSDNITAINLLPDKRLIIGNEIGDIYLYEKNSFSKILFKKKFGPSRVRQVVLLPENGWVAAFDNSLYAEKNGVFNRKYKVNDPQSFPTHISAPKYIFHEPGRTWIAHSRGLHYWDSGEELPTMVITRIRVTAIGKDDEDNIWAGGIDGLLSEKDNFSVNWGKRFKEVSGRIIDINQSEDGQLWVVTAELGFLKVKVNNGEVKSVEIINDLIDEKINGIKSMHKAKDGHIWLATNNGIYGLDDELNIQHIDMTDGLPNNDVNAVAVDHDTLWAATVSGLAKIQLNQGKGDGNFATYISGAQYELNGKTVNIDLVNHPKGDIVIPSGASGIDIQLSGLHFKSAGNLTFEYVEQERPLPIQWLTWGNLAASLAQRLKGTCDTVTVNNGHRYFGANAPSGRFVTTVTAISKNGTRSLQPDKRAMTILPYWYETAWFSILVMGIIGLAIWRFFRQRNEVKRFQRAASELQLQAIKAQINPHFIGNSINAIQQFFYPPDPVKASQYISIFTSLLRRTMHLSEVPFITFNEELSFIADYLEMVKLRFGDRIEYILPGIDEIPEGTPFPAMILQPILENATIHGLAPEDVAQIEVAFQFIGQQLECTVSDNGVGIEVSRAIKKSQKHNRVSKGLNLLKKKIEVLNKMHALDIKIDFQDLSTLGVGRHGTKVTLSFSPGKIALHAISKT